MMTLHRRRRLGATVTYDTNPHAMHYRACNADRFDAARDQFAVARAVFDALLCVGAFGALLGLGVVAILMLAGPA